MEAGYAKKQYLLRKKVKVLICRTTNGKRRDTFRKCAELRFM